MAKGVKIKIEKDILYWAREAAGLSIDEAAKKTKISGEEIKKWEAESSEIRLSDIKKFAKHYKRQLSFFFLPEAPKEKPIPDDFRTLDSIRHEEIPEKVRLAIRRAQANRKIIKDFFASEYEIKISGSISLHNNATTTAVDFRTRFNVSIEQQFSLKDEKTALAFWIEKMEEKGIPVFQMDLDKNFRGFCLRENDLPPVIVVNVKDTRAGKIFTVIHEFCHLFIKQADIDQLIYQKGEDQAHKTIEAFVNEFAGSFLVPNGDIKKQDLFNQYVKSRNDELLSKLAKKFAVSESVIVRRMYALGVINKDEYEKKLDDLKIRYEQIKAIKLAKLKADPDSFVPRNVPKETIQKVGLTLGAKAFQAVSDGRMTTFDLVQFLDVKTQHVNGVQALLEKKYLSLT